jgi:hypothetical protein
LVAHRRIAAATSHRRDDADETRARRDEFLEHRAPPLRANTEMEMAV